jgi:hypothetical protein
MPMQTEGVLAGKQRVSCRKAGIGTQIDNSECKQFSIRQKAGRVE